MESTLLAAVISINAALLALAITCQWLTATPAGDLLPAFTAEKEKRGADMEGTFIQPGLDPGCSEG